MRKAEDWYRENANTILTIPDVIKLAQLEAIEESCKVCAENAHVTYYSERYSDPWQVNKDSILNCIEILKKEAE